MQPLLLTHGAVIQRDAMLPLSGHTTPHGTVAICYLGKRATAVADAAGHWHLSIGPLAGGGPDDFTIESEGSSVVFRNVVVGDVWICSGQSNMAMALCRAENGVEDAARADDSLLRLLTVPKRVSPTPTTAVGDCEWHVCMPDTVAEFSALAYYAGRDLRRAVDVPIGLVLAAVGETPCEAWVPMDVLTSNVQYSPILARWQQSLRDFPDSAGAYAKAFAQWDREADSNERAGKPLPGPHPKLIGPDHHWTPAGLFNGMIAPLTQTPVKGVFWYQGTAAPDRAFQYRSLFRGLIRSWRAAWGIDDLPFVFGQEASFGPRRDTPAEHSWAELREAQDMAQSEPNTGMAVAIDIGEATDIHPIYKEPLGQRMALLARRIAYGEDHQYTGPTYRLMAIEDNKIRIHFDHVYEGLTTNDGGALVGFSVSPGCSDFSSGHRGFVWAQAKIEDNTVLVWSDEVDAPVAVRYAWAQNPNCNLTNSSGLPAAPFRTDDWPGVTNACC